MLIEGGQFQADRWRGLADDEALPSSGAVTVSFARWSREREILASYAGELGLRLPNDVAVTAIAGDLGRFALIVLDFPRFTDGRAYSQARLLRHRLHYRGGLRAVGNVLRDQLLFMRRVGFDSFEVGERARTEHWLEAFAEVDVFFQPAEDRGSWAMRRRLAG